MRRTAGILMLIGGLAACVDGGAPPSATSVSAGTAGPMIVQSCAGCHGQGGAGSGPVPPITGRSREQLVATLNAFRANQQPASIMGRVARGYTDAEIGAMADYFAARR